MKNNIIFDDITFDGRNYHTRTVHVPGWGERTIASIVLKERLMQDGKYSSNEARLLDETIFFYADAEAFSSLSDKELGAFVAKEVA